MAVVTQIQVRRGTASQWTSANPTLAAGEQGFETDTLKLKIGNGSTAWNSLAYVATGSIGTVTSIEAGTGLSGGTITTNGIISLSTPVSAANGGTGLSSLGTGVATFLGTPSSSNLASAVTDETGSGSLVFSTSPTLVTPVITQGQSTPTFSTNAYTLIAGDAGQLLLANNSSTAGTISIPTDATTNFAIGTQITILNVGSGLITVQAATPGTTTVRSTGATATAPKCRAQYSAMTLWKQAANLWYAFGDLS
jgi:hypothetical protein